MIRTRDGALRLGPDDDGAAVELDELDRADLVPGHRYELVAGRLAVSPEPQKSHEDVASWLMRRLVLYAETRPDLIQGVSTRSRIIDVTRETSVQPDLALYRVWPRRGRWEDVSPLLVVEVLSDSTERKDTVRNRDVYQRVPSVQECWIVDGRDEASPPSLLALVRGPDGWVERPVSPGGSYRTDLLPGLELDLREVG